MRPRIRRPLGGRDDRGLDEIDPAAVPPVSRRQEIVGAGGLALLLGAWLIVSPLVLGYERGARIASDLAAGSLIVIVALTRVTLRRRDAWLAWTSTVVGIWVLASAFLWDRSAAVRWNEAFVGAAIIVLSALGASASDAARR